MENDVEKKLELCREIVAHRGKCYEIKDKDCNICPFVNGQCECESSIIVMASQKYIDENGGEWIRFSKKELWKKIQEIRQLVGSDGTRDICDDIKSYAERYDSAPGMTKREHIAAMAMQGLLSNSTTPDTTSVYIARSAVLYADALIKKLEETK